MSIHSHISIPAERSLLQPFRFMSDEFLSTNEFQLIFSFLSSLCAFFEVFSDYDPFLGHCAPSNPWLTSDTDRWDLFQPL